ncbi:MAG: CotH kinase family protein, partial [Verrucomicrobiota bacterium]|nr:CotH kinase family protein [Verrucomicrobiota bacterium]
MNHPPKCYRTIILLCCSILFLISRVFSAPIINEFVALNKSTLYDEDGQSSDWIEIHNPHQDTVDLEGYFLTNDPEDLKKWKFPKVSLAVDAYLIVFASGKDRDNGELHTNFRISKSGGYLGLVDPDGKTVISELSEFPVQFEDFSYGIKTDGESFSTTLVREGDACKLLVPTNDIGTTWHSLNYNDETWSDATTGIGYERSNGYENLIGAGGDIEEQTYDENSTAYIRIPFSMNSLDGLSSLIFRMKYDDGFIAYINGTEIASGNKPASPSWNSDASTDHPDSQATSFVDTDLSAQASEIVRTGNNLLAIHVMNGDTRSSDLLALPRLEAQFVIKPDEGAEPKPPELGYFQTPSPGKNNGSDSGLPSGPVLISQPGRGFTGNLTLSLSTTSPQAQIRYTTNGSLPTEVSPLYTGSTITLGSSTLLRARSFEEGLTAGPVSESGYIRLSTDAQNFSSDLPVIIMERFSNGGTTAANGKTFTFFAFFEPDPQTGRTRLNGPYSIGTRGGWKVRGSSSSGFSKKAFSIEAWNELNQNKNISPLGLPEESDFILNARSVYDRSLMRNAFIYELSNQVGRYAVRTKFVELFKDDNGGNLSYSNDYDGVYTFMEKISRDKERVDVERLTGNVSEEPGITGGYILKVDRLDPGDSGLRAGGQTLGWVYPKEDDVSTDQSNWVREYMNEMSSALSTDKFEDYINTLSWVDHHLLNILTLNADALRLSTFFHKKRNGKLEYGPIWDFDRSMESTDGRDNNPSTWSGGTSYFTFPWWGSLFDNENFWQVYIDRYFELREGEFATSNVHSIIDRMATGLNEAQARNFRRWSEQPRFGSFQGEVNHLKDWLGTRLDWMDGQFAPRPTTNKTAGSYPSGTRITLNANLAGNQNIYYTLDGSDPRPPDQSDPLDGTTIIDEDIPVRALVPNSDIGLLWNRDLNFNDGSWMQGTNGVGYERSNGYDPYINIDVDDEMSGRTSCYIRIKFNLTQTDIEKWNYMILQMRYDDGFVAYLNGTRIASAQAPGNLTWNSSATQTHDDGSATLFQKFDTSNFINQLKSGQNLLAIHALNESTSSSDFLNQVKLITGFDEGAGEGGTNGFKYTGPITLQKTARIFARVFDSDGGNSTSSGQTPVGTGWSAPLKVEYLVNEDPASAAN